MTFYQHTIASGITSLVFMAISRSSMGAFACFISGIFLDLDHLIDYILRKKRICFRLSELENFCTNEKEGKLYLFLHNYELLVVLWVLTFLFFNHPIWVGLLFGMSVHLLLDQIYNQVHPLAYFWFYRAKAGFPQKIFFKEDYIKDVSGRENG
ncbi:MAG: hypothetical protein U9Q21_00520 [Candidatus Auribacterota bacterium]|nr:hypothetical protein [Candidatus Auribacterota bacterium]